ncbi:YifB family Mg chelatase-like AAA ATPase [Actinocatenispora sera]|uniref:AAA+ ATPase domain-containing protein n=1 Tax=Actinocatenispora sera TaxID=390989 RepID=A0A810LAM3_9ACTN|nr:YifB family Mg chelatase-like AAA ATPase [Actinocatenispora sera]BCJ31078.1 hypothetical protein Asera_51860 [Actinocatenispora sera]
MGYARVLSVGLLGLTGRLIEIEADLSAGLPGMIVSGLPDAAVNESRERIRAAVINSGLPWPNRRITVNLLPASVPKHGSLFDLGVAAAVLCAAGAVPVDRLHDVALIGELGLDGRVRQVRGVLPAVLAAGRSGVHRVLVPAGNGREAALVPDTVVQTVDTLAMLLAHLRGETELPGPAADDDATASAASADLVDVVGQERGRRAIEIAAAGGHNVALFGPPGAGKTMLAERLPGVLPSLSDEQALEVTAVHSVVGALPGSAGLLRQPPYQAPHHTSTPAAIVGGGSGLPRPGAISLAHHGVLFLDEAPEYRPGVLNALREPLENGEIRLARASGSVCFPARFQLVLAANPCPCGERGGDCLCSPLVRRRYLGRLSGPLLDRVDLQLDLLPVRSAHLLVEGQAPEDSATVAARVRQARDSAAVRWSGGAGPLNATIPGRMLRSGRWRLPRTVSVLAERLVDSGALSARGYDRVLRIAWTVADLAGRSRPDAGDVAEAIELRTRTTP